MIVKLYGTLKQITPTSFVIVLGFSVHTIPPLGTTEKTGGVEGPTNRRVINCACQEHSEDTDVDESTSQGSERSERSDSVMDAARTWTKKQARPTIK